MFKWLKKHFVPHAGNNHRPHFLHEHNVRKVILIMLVVEFVVFVLPSVVFFRNGFNFTAAVLPGVLSSLSNDQRVTYGLTQLSENPTLARAAELKAQDMAARGYFSHNTPEGYTPWYWLGLAGYQYAFAGENLAINFSDSRDVVNAWMNSPTHRDNVLRQGFTEVGSAVAVGMYQGKQTIFAVQYYAKPKAALVAPAPQPAQPVATQPRPAPVPQPATQTAVLGEETPTTEPVPTPATEPAPVLAEATKLPQAPNSLIRAVEKSATSPMHTMSIVLIAMLCLVAFAVIVNSFTGVHKMHPDLLTNGLALAVIVFGIYMVNDRVLTSSPVVPTDFATTFEASA